MSLSPTLCSRMATVPNFLGRAHDQPCHPDVTPGRLIPEERQCR